MNNLYDMVWIEFRKAIRSKMPLWTILGSLLMPLGIALLIFIARNPDISKKVGIIGAKANLITYSTTDWPTYLGLIGQVIAAGGFFLYILIISWIFGREFVDGTLKDMLAVPVQRSSMLFAKFIMTAVCSIILTIGVLTVTLITGAFINLPGGSAIAIINGISMILVTSILVIVTIFPFAFFASLGRGYLLPLGLAIITLMITNLVAVMGWGEYFPWAIPGIYLQLKNPLHSISYGIVICTGLLGMYTTYLWWKYADQNR